MKLFLLIFVIFSLSACGQKLDGTYENINRNISFSLTFDGGNVTQKTWMGKSDQNAQEVEFPYELDDNKIKVKGLQDTAFVIGTLQKDGSIKGSMALMGGTFTKQKK